MPIKRYQKTVLFSSTTRPPSPPPSPSGSEEVHCESDEDLGAKYEFRYRTELSRKVGKPFEKLIAIPMPKEVCPTPPISSSTTVMSYKKVVI